MAAAARKREKSGHVRGKLVLCGVHLNNARGKVNSFAGMSNGSRLVQGSIFLA